MQQQRAPTVLRVAMLLIRSRSAYCARSSGGRPRPVPQRVQRPSGKRTSEAAAPCICHAAAAARVYEWSYQLDAAPLPELELQLTGSEGAEDLVEKLSAAADASFSSAPSSSSSSSPVSGSRHTLAASSVEALLQMFPPSPADLSGLLTAPLAAKLLACLARLRASVPQPWLEAMLTGPLAATSAASACSTRQLAEVAWAVSELCETSGPGSPAMAWSSDLLTAAVPRLQDFYAPDLAALLGSCGALHRDMLTKPGQEPSTAPTPSTAAEAPWQKAIAEEACYQLAEFMADFRALDVAQLASGLAGLKVPMDSKLRTALMKAVYSKTNTIEEKAAVDFALAKLEAGARAMHFDPRWTHEELRWLPRSERDKRRIIKEGWVRTQWGGYSPGGGR